MYNHILVAIEHSEADRAVIEHVEQLARMTGARLLLVHVADGWAARAYNELKLRDSEEIRDDREYLTRLCDEMAERGFKARTRLAMGDPATELVKVAAEESVDLIAMSTHGRSGIGRVVFGSVSDAIIRNSHLPVILIRPNESHNR